MHMYSTEYYDSGIRSDLSAGQGFCHKMHKWPYRVIR